MKIHKKIFQLSTHSFEETQSMGQKIGRCIEKETVITLTGELGSGKTLFVQGLAKGLDVPKEYYITSPSYTLINEYPARYTLFHVDLYRLGDPIEFEDTGLYEILNGDGVVAIEWADRLPEDLLVDYLAINFKIIDDTSRKICITAYGLEAGILLSKFEKFI